jgi:AAA+ ATPase superfamily predicted ATPase
MKFINREREMLEKLWREKEQRHIVIYRKRNIGK